MPGPKLNITDFVRGKIISHPPVACVLEMVSYSEHVLSLPFFVSFFFLSLYFLFFCLFVFFLFPPIVDAQPYFWIQTQVTKASFWPSSGFLSQGSVKGQQ